MKKPLINLFFTIINILLFYRCSSGGNDPNSGPTVVDPPGVANLIFPNQNSECTEGTNITNSESDVTFDWEDATNANSYELYLKNLNTQNTSSYNSSVSELTLTILRGTPYSWYVVSRNTGTQTSQSTTWKFYNVGDAISSYAPFPAEIVSPEMGSSLSSSTNSIILEWKGSDIDNDIESYEVLYGTASTPTNSIGTTSETNLSVNTSSGNTYYWRIITYDSQNNNSESEIFQFRIE